MSIFIYFLDRRLHTCIPSTVKFASGLTELWKNILTHLYVMFMNTFYVQNNIYVIHFLRGFHQETMLFFGIKRDQVRNIQTANVELQRFADFRIENGSMRLSDK